MLTPGATTSGLRSSGTTWLGPRDEKPATTGALFLLMTVSQPKLKDPTGLGSVAMYALSFSPAV